MKTKFSVISLLPALLLACSPAGEEKTMSPGLFSNKPATLRVSLTDKPLDGATAVNVNIAQMELLLEKGGKAARLVIGKDMGVINLLELRDGVLLPVADITSIEGITVRQIRLVLHGDGNHVVREDQSICPLQTPSAQQSGVKIIMKNPVTFEAGHSYAMVVDFDAEKSVVLKGNGECLLKPVLKLKSFTKKVDPEPTPEPSPAPSPQPSPEPTPDPCENGGCQQTQLVDGTDGNDTETDDGYDYQDPIYPEITEDMIGPFF